MRAPFLVPCLALAAALSGAEGDAERALRQQEAAQRQLALATAAGARQLADLSDEARFNRIGDPAEIERLAASAVVLATVSDERGGAGTMDDIAGRLQAALRDPGRARDELRQAAAGARTVADSLDQAAKALVEAEAAGGLKALGQLADRQRGLQKATDDLAAAVAGKRDDELSAAERGERERLVREQEKLARQVDEAAAALEQAAGADAQQQAEMRQAAAALRQAAAGKSARQAAADLARNDLDHAAGEQQKVIEALEKAPRGAASAVEQQAQLDRRQQELASLQQAQEQLAADTAQLKAPPSAAELNRLAARQADLAAQMRQLDAAEARRAAEQARDALLRQERGQAQAAMKQAAAALQQLRQQAQQARQAQPQPPGPAAQPPAGPQGQGGSASEAVDRALARKRDGAWQVRLDGQERETVGSAASGRFPGRYEAALSRYYQALAQDAEGR